MDFIDCDENYSRCCRTCLDDDETKEMFNIYENNGTVNTAELLYKYTGIQVTEEDLLPKRLCSNCYRCLINFHKFANIAQNVDKKLQDYFRLRNCKSEISPDHDSLEEDIYENSIEAYFIESDYREKTPSLSGNNHFTDKKDNINDINSSIITVQIRPKFKQLKCEICYKKFRKQSIFEHHLQTHLHQTSLTIDEIPNHSLVCEVCSLTFKSIPSLSAHKKVHIAKDRVLQCKICKKIFKKISHLKRHELSHNDNHLYKCTLCPKTFATADNLAAHINKHNGIKNHHCPICIKTFANVRTLANHIKLHKREKPYLCPTCGKMFESSTNLNQHMRRHAGVRLYACNLCPAKFITKGELKSHGMTHSGERSFVCEQCNSAFIKRSYLEKHKLTHLGLKPHQCDVCSMRFTDKNHLKRHYRIHTGEKPYRCNICDRGFAQSNDLVKHKRTHLGNNLYKCDECNQSFRLKTELSRHISEHFVSAQLQSKILTEKLQDDVKTDIQNIVGTILPMNNGS